MTIYEEIQNIIGSMPTELDFTYIIACFIFLLLHYLIIKVIIALFNR